MQICLYKYNVNLNKVKKEIASHLLFWKKLNQGSGGVDITRKRISKKKQNEHCFQKLNKELLPIM